MKRKTYIKPAFTIVKLEWNNLCAGSICTTIDINLVNYKTQKNKAYIYKRKETKDMWETDF